MKVEVCPVCACYLNFEEGEWYCSSCDYSKLEKVVTKSIYKGLE